MIITIARKPFKGALIDNIALNQCGGLNIDQSRIRTTDGKPPYSYPKGAGGVYSQKYQRDSATAKNWNNWTTVSDNPPVQGSALGRWPANVLLSHIGCSQVGVVTTKGKVGGYSYEGNTYQVEGFVPECKPKAPSNYGGEEILVWSCVHFCPTQILETQSEVQVSGIAGGASRFFKVVKE